MVTPNMIILRLTNRIRLEIVFILSEILGELLELVLEIVAVKLEPGYTLRLFAHFNQPRAQMCHSLLHYDYNQI